jgi:ERCC4-related helicase
MSNIQYTPNDNVHHDSYGAGQVIMDNGNSVIVRFESGIQECEKSTLNKRLTPRQAIYSAEWHRPLEVITKIQAEAIQSVNDAWGVFSCSRISLLPHQLWVCRRVLETWPARWLVADDVGLGKTVEAGLILWPLLSREKVRRILILCPASLTEQWQVRLRTMFDIRMTVYNTASDTKNADYWNTHNQVIASIQTIRKDHKGRHNRLLESKPWDLILVDEAHHLNADEKGGPTHAFSLVEDIVENNLVESMVFLTGTPHRGKNYGFLSLLSLLRPDLFDPGVELSKQLQHLSKVMIRNNKQNVTDLKGKRLFKKTKVDSVTYEYAPEEELFYNQLTEFISTGKAYASSLDGSVGSTVMLILISMQKLASSSVAAIRKALVGRLGRLQTARKRLDDMGKYRDKLIRMSESDNFDDFEYLSRLEEEIVQLSNDIVLMQDEEPRLQELVDLANYVKEETKINKILELTKTRFPDRHILFFTEYKATQSLLMSALIKEYGDKTVTFINGDNEARGVVFRNGEVKDIKKPRESAVDDFNSGDVRFMVSTEAAGEGIDLQESCHTLIHVDLPWNPMRLHQRVGRLNRHGQKNRVEVMSLHNPHTVESRIWDILNEKIENIMLTLKHVMADPDDLFQLVLGMTSSSLFTETFAEAENVPKESLSDWFDEKSANFGGKDVIETVKELIGHSARFDYDEVSEEIPRVDLPDLKPFMLGMLSLNGRLVRQSEENDTLGFKTPDRWREEPGVRRKYDGMTFDRNYRGRDGAVKILGVGNRVVNLAIRQARESFSCLMTAKGIKCPIYVFRIIDRVTTTGGSVRSVIAGLTPGQNGEYGLLRDWELVKEMNEIISLSGIKKAETSSPPPHIDSVDAEIEKTTKEMNDRMNALSLPFKIPACELLAVMLPAADQ